MRKQNLVKVFFIFLIASLSGFFVSSLGLSGMELSGGFFNEYVDNSRPNVVIIDFDRMSQDRMSCYGHYRNTTPNICSFGERNVFFENAVSQSGWTASSVASIITSQQPGAHGIIDESDRLSPKKVTMTEILRAEGYTTAAFPVYVDNKTPSGLPERYNLNQGFQNYQKNNKDLDHQIKDLRKWLEKDRQRPYFLYIQSFDVHRYDNWRTGGETREFRENYTRPEIKAGEFEIPSSIRLVNGTYTVQARNGSRIPISDRKVAYIKAQYDDMLREVDHDFQDLMDLLKKQEVYSNSIIIVTANHGEMVDTRNMSKARRFTHGDVYDDNINVPLMIRLPDRKSEDIDRQVRLIDIFPTVIDELGMEEKSHENIQGGSMRPLYTGTGSYSSSMVFSRSYGGNRYAVRNKSWKYISSLGPDELYNLERDPEEHYNVINENPEIARKMLKYLEKNRKESRIIYSTEKAK